ncbi:hypothetical protein BHS07_22110 [Myxococcus xanthus]|nr:hypothetical protein BHS07_22110 [Myxococcus xanthus]
MRAELIERWQTADGQRRRSELLQMGLRGNWPEALSGFVATSELGDNPRDLRGIDLSGQDLASADLVRARLEGARLDGSGLEYAQLDLATLTGASLRLARLNHASLHACVALGTQWDDAQLEGTRLTASNLTGSSFRRARFRDAQLEQTILLNADLRNADLRDARLFLCDLEGALLTCVQWNPPRTYPVTSQHLAEIARRAGFPSFIEPLLVPGGIMDLLHMSNRQVLLHVEAAIEASTDVQSELRAILHEKNWRIVLMAAAGIVLAGADEVTLAALWARIDEGSWVHPQLTVAAVLRDPSCDDRVRERLMHHELPRRNNIRESLEWAATVGRNVLGLREPHSGHHTCQAHRWLRQLQAFAPLKVQEQWLRGGSAKT